MPIFRAGAKDAPFTGSAIASFDGPGDAPFNDPLNNPSRINWHTDFRYPQVVDDRTVTATIPPATVFNGEVESTVLLFAHGRPNTPFCDGWIVGFSGFGPGAQAVGHQFSQGTVFFCNAQELGGVELAVDATNVYFRYVGAGFAATGPQVTATVRVLVFDEGI